MSVNLFSINKPDEAAYSCEPPVSIILPVAITALIMLTGFTLFEMGKHFLFGPISIWNSHTITIFFSTIIASVVAFCVLRKQNQLMKKAFIEFQLRNKAEKALQDNSHCIAVIFDAIPAMISYVDTDERYRYVNRGYEEWFGLERDSIVGKNILALLGADSYQAVKPFVGKAFSGEEVSYEYEFPRHDGVKRVLRTHYIPHLDAEMAISGYFVLAFDITEDRRKELELKEKQGQLASLAVELSVAEENERRRIASELHDQVGQNLILARIKLARLSKELTGNISHQGFTEVNDLLDQSVQDIRSLIFQLSPPLLSTMGLEAAIEWLGEQLQADYDLKVNIQCDNHAIKLSNEMQTTIFNTIRELLINVAKHACTKIVKLSISTEVEFVRFIVEDEGSGFDIAAVSMNPGKEGGFGLYNIRQRIEHLGGKLFVESAIGRGTRTTIIAPADKIQMLSMMRETDACQSIAC